MYKRHDIPVSVQDNPKEYRRIYRLINKDRIKEYNHSRKTRMRDEKRERKEKLIQIKGGKCEYCGRLFDGSNQCIFDFHHVGNDKLFIIAPYNRPFDALVEEVSKCSLVCATCHRMIHWNEQESNGDITDGTEV